MRRISYIISLAFFVSLFFSSCEDFLEKDPIGKETSGNFFAVGDNAEYAINACYDIMTYSESVFYGGGHSYEFMIGDILSDDSEKGSTESDLVELINMKNWELMPGDFSDFYDRCYAGLYRVNNTLLNLPNVELESEELKNTILGEAYFIRAYWHFYLLRLYGQAPMFTKPVASNEFGTIKAATFGQLFEQIESDLDEAISRLPKKSSYSSLPYQTGTEGRATKATAQAYKARVLMFHIGYIGEDNNASWQDVSNLTNSIINSGEYALTSNYAEIHEFEGENNIESIFEIQYLSDGSGDNPNYETGHEKTSYTGTVFQGNRNLSGWGFNTPTQDLYDAYGDNDARRECTIIKDGDYEHGVQHEISADHTRTFYLSRKAQLDPALNGAGGSKDSEQNVRLMRYADVLLMAAEASYHLQKENEARNFVNQVRTRARKSTFPKGYTTIVNEYAITGYTNNIPDITSSGSALLDDIYKERRLEFGMEMLHYWDLVRTGKYINMLKNKYSADVASKCESHCFTTSNGSKIPVLPIPQSEVDSWGLDQNPGY